jgi:putative transposase
VGAALAEDLELCLACLAFPVARQPRLRTTTGLERLNQELKRRARVVRIFPNRGACLRLVSALCIEQSEEWLSGRRYLDLAEIVGAGAEQLRAG